MTSLLAIDQGAKIVVRIAIPLHQSTNLVPHLLDLTHVENRGVSFSFLGNLDDSLRVPLLTLISVTAIALLAFYWWRHRAEMNPWQDWAFVLILPGAVGNLIDRGIFGTVTDFFHFRFVDTSFFVNNLADIMISLGVMAYLVGVFLVRAAGEPGN